MRILAKRFRRLWCQSRRVKSIKWLMLTLLGIRAQIRVTLRGLNIVVRTSTPDLEVAISCLDGEFDSLCVAVPVLRHNLIVDAGGYIGTAALAFARRYPTATILTIEPSTSNYELLTKNTAAFPNIIPINKALSAAHGTVNLYDRCTGEWGFTIVEKAADRTTSFLNEVQCVTVDDLLAQFGATGVDIFKIDIEGGEQALLSRNTEWIHKTNALCIELHDRIVPGCSDAWQLAVAGRNNFKSEGEKYVSLTTA